MAVIKLMNLPTGLKLTRKQKEILELIYKYRFLNRIQIQAFLKHKDYKTINLWLKDLRAKHYLEWIYSTNFTEKTKPAIYYLGINGIRYFKNSDSYPTDELRKRYREPSRSQTYIDRCLLLVDCCLTLSTTRDDYNWYFFETEADYQKDSYYHFLMDNESGIHPHLCFSKDIYEGGASEPTIEHSYLLEIFDATLPRYRIKKRLSNYVNYLDQEEDDWEESSEDDNLPIILMVCPRTTDLIYAKRRTRGLLAEVWEHDDEDRPHIRFTTAEKLRQFGILADEIWEEA